MCKLGEWDSTKNNVFHTQLCLVASDSQSIDTRWCLILIYCVLMHLHISLQEGSQHLHNKVQSSVCFRVVQWLHAHNQCMEMLWSPGFRHTLPPMCLCLLSTWCHNAWPYLLGSLYTVQWRQRRARKKARHETNVMEKEKACLENTFIGCLF